MLTGVPGFVTMHDQEVFSVREAAAFLRVSENTIRRRLGDGSLKGILWGRRTIRITRAAIEDFQQGHSTDQPRPPRVAEAIAHESRLDRDGRRAARDMYDFPAQREVVVASGEVGPVVPQQPKQDPQIEAQMKGSDFGRPVLYSVDDVAEILKVSTKTVRRSIADGRLGHVRLGRLLRVTEEQLREYLAVVERPSTVVGMRPSSRAPWRTPGNRRQRASGQE